MKIKPIKTPFPSDTNTIAIPATVELYEQSGTGRRYEKLRAVLNCSGSREGEIMVLYRVAGTTEPLYVRDLKGFEKLFQRVKADND